MSSFPVDAARATTNGTAASAAKTINLPAGCLAGHILVCLIRTAVIGAYTFPGDWTKLADDASDASDDQTAVAYHLCTGGEGASISVSSGNGKFAAIVWRVTGGANPAVRAPQLSVVAVGTSVSPNPTSLSPTGGSKKYLWLWLGGWEDEQTSPPAGTPLNYVNAVGADSGTASTVTTNCRVAGASRQLQAVSEDPPVWTISASDDWTAWTMAVHPAPTVTAVGQAFETDLAQAVTRVKSRLVGQVTETDLAQAVTRAVAGTLVDQAFETDLSQAMTRLKTRAVGQVTEFDLSQAVVRIKTKAVAQVFETDLAQGVTRVKRITIGQVLEGDLAQVISRLKTLTIAQVLETDLAQPVTRAGLTVTVNQVVEADLAQAVARLKTKAVGQVLETDLAQPLGRLKTLAVNGAFETDLSQDVGVLKIILVGQVIEVDLSQIIAHLKTKMVGQAIETGLAQAVAWAPKNRLVGQTMEEDFAEPITVVLGGGKAPVILCNGRHYFIAIP